MLIVNGDPATLEPKTQATPAFHDFLHVALVKDPATRPSAAQLLEHEWVASAVRAPLAELVAEQEEVLRLAVRGCSDAADAARAARGRETRGGSGNCARISSCNALAPLGFEQRARCRARPASSPPSAESPRAPVRVCVTHTHVRLRASASRPASARDE